jgi:short-subunit dehydrogenase
MAESGHESGPLALITGASSGIGLELARRFAQANFDLILIGRNAEALGALASQLSQKSGNTAAPMAIDLAQPGAAAKIAASVAASGRPVDVLVNNAGFAMRGRFPALALERQMAMVQVHVAALTELTHRLLPAMVARRQGRILNVAALAAFAPGPMMAVYHASKAYVLNLSEALSEELIGTGVTVTCLCPGPTATKLAAGAQMRDSFLFKFDTSSAAEVANAGFDGLMAGSRIVIPGRKNAALITLLRFLPRRWVTAAVMFLQG